ncbi:DNA-binding transcriptional regulator, MarR family [Hyphomicrobiales bacterium]|nr:DNA-binding transcriptional regulator, MarR family [Hyphomicrobiales bacterium]CAH1701487.1 DNA-binding transcriptional regulator, MarR family [Hyphomicrobiales bacterium]CAI0345444.1 DNA-binding transcriptional regulator, MarR family [Hyphomicrobiales bacterium]
MPKEDRRRTVAKPELLDRDGDARFRDLLHNLFAFGSRLDDARARFAGYIGLTPPQYLILIAVSLAAPESEMGVAQVAERLHLSGAFVTIEVNKLVKQGLIAKDPHSSDKRRVNLTVTARGFEKLERLATLQRPVNDALFAPLDRADFEYLGQIMRRLATGADQAIHLADHLIASESTAPATT